MKRRATQRQRRTIWRQSDGACSACGAPLGESFHADHKTIPWSVGHDTNIHDLQPLCASCNARKGNQMLRIHQQKALKIASDPRCGHRFKKVLVSVTPGGGKSLIPVIFAKEMIRSGVAQKVCWIVPRDSLRKQAEETFLDEGFRALVGHKLTIRAAGNDINPSRGLDGYAVNYQAVANDPDLHADEFRRHRYVLVLDEVHHLRAGGSWHQGIQPLVDRAALVVVMTGTLSRADRSEIAFVEYDRSDGKVRPATTDTDTQRAVLYTRRNALEEKAILPIYFEHVDGAATWIDRTGNERSVNSLKGIGDDTSAALYTALGKSYAFDLMKAMLDHWKDYAKHNKRSKFLVVAPNISLAKVYLQQARRLGFDDIDIATSDDTDEAKANIDRFKGRQSPTVRGLMTVGMAYEGLDVPEITHIACLTHIRSHEWIEQMLARATRVDRKAGPYHMQAAHVWAPDDDLFSEAIKRIKDEQAPFIREHEGIKEGGGEGGTRNTETIIPLDASVTETRAGDMQSGEVVDAREYRAVKEAMREAGLGFLPVLQAKKLLDAYSRTKGDSEVEDIENDRTQTPSEKEAALRSQIDRRIKLAAGGDPERIKTINKKLVKRFKKRRSDLTLDELITAFKIIEMTFGRESDDDASAG